MSDRRPVNATTLVFSASLKVESITGSGVADLTLPVGSELASLLAPEVINHARAALAGERSQGSIQLGDRKVFYWTAPTDLSPGSAPRAGILLLLEANPESDSEQQREDFASLAAHELKTPISTLRLHLDYQSRILALGPLSEFRRSKLEEMSQVGLAMIDLLSEQVENLLDQTRLGDADFSLYRTEFELSELVIDILVRMSSAFSFAGCISNLSVRQSVRGLWDKSRIQQVIVNLLSNAIKFGAGKPVAIEVDARDDMAILKITDGGIGIHADDLSRIFESFERGSGTEAFPGVGLGLYIGRRIATAHQGRILVQSQAGEGACFTLELPIRPTPADSDPRG